jgi:hypothetical protein
MSSAWSGGSEYAVVANASAVSIEKMNFINGVG